MIEPADKKGKTVRKVQVEKAKNLTLLYLPSSFNLPVRNFVGRRTKDQVEITDPKRGVSFVGENTNNPASKNGYVLLRITEWGISLTLMQAGLQLRKKVKFREEGEDSAKVIAAQNKKIDFRKTREDTLLPE